MSDIRVKPLEWQLDPNGLPRSLAWAATGLYMAGRYHPPTDTGMRAWWIGNHAKKHFAKDLEAAKAAAQAEHESLIRSCLLDKPEAVEGNVYIIPRELTDEEWSEVKYNVDRKASPDIPLWRIQEAVRYANFIAGHRGRQMIKIPSPTPADTDAAQMQEVALARATAREDLFPAMSSRIKAEREQARRKAFEKAAQIAYQTCAETRHVKLGDACAAAIRQCAEEGK